VDKPPDCKEVVLESYNLCRVVKEDLELFTNLTFLDLGDNNLRLEFFGSLPSLKELHLQCNGITTIGHLQGFPELKVRICITDYIGDSVN
jgi:Leucine-rich repeat (LRR) protein